jgi:REP element-mobilizing transposase RayT
MVNGHRRGEKFFALMVTNADQDRGERFFAPTGGMTIIPRRPHRKSIRLQGYDYSQEGAYFVTLCTKDRAHLFGEIINDQMLLNDAGRRAQECWGEIPVHFRHVELDIVTIMPNHIHGIFVIVPPSTGAKDFSPLRQKGPGTAKTVGSIVRGFKVGVTKWMRNFTEVQEVWQRNYWEHIIRNEREIELIREYIENNPARWNEDQLNS